MHALSVPTGCRCNRVLHSQIRQTGRRVGWQDGLEPTDRQSSVCPTRSPADIPPIRMIAVMRLEAQRWIQAQPLNPLSDVGLLRVILIRRDRFGHSNCIGQPVQEVTKLHSPIPAERTSHTRLHAPHRFGIFLVNLLTHQIRSVAVAQYIVAERSWIDCSGRQLGHRQRRHHDCFLFRHFGFGLHVVWTTQSHKCRCPRCVFR